MSKLIAVRVLIRDALDAAGIDVYTTGQWSAPCVQLKPGDPWGAVDLSLHGKRTSRWQLILIAGKADQEAVIETLAELIDQVDAALLTIPGVQLPTWARPFDNNLSGADYASTTATIQLLTQEA